MLSQHIFRAYDIRGIYGTDFDEHGAKKIAFAYADFLKKKYPYRKNLTVALGRDGRNSGEILMQFFEEGLLESGLNVVNVGMVMSPMLYFAICAEGLDGGVMITASHNPAAYNGFKLQSSGAHSICGDDIQKIWQMTQEISDIAEEKHEQTPKNFLTQKSEEKAGKKTEIDIEKSYFETLSLIVHFQNTKWKLAIDAGNGIAGKFAPSFFRQFGFEVTEIFCEVDGNFPNHDADPERAENLETLKKTVIEKNLDFGLAFDGDGDRIGVVDRQGNHFSADLLLLLLARDVLSRNPNASIVYDLKATELLKEEIEKLGGKAVMCKTGHSFVEEKMQEEDALLGGEVSGHIFCAEHYFGFDDALLAAAKLVEIASVLPHDLTEIFAQLPKTFVTPEEKILVPEAKKFEIVEKVVAKLLEKYPDALTIDGIRIAFEKGAWGIVRASNTSPYLTTRFEARDEKTLQKIRSEVLEVVYLFCSA